MKHTTPWTNQKMNPIDVQERLNGYIDMVQHKMNDYWNSMNFTNDGRDNEVPVIEVEYGKKYARVIHRDYNVFQRSVHSFVTT